MGFFTRWRRRRLLAKPFPSEWEAAIESGVAVYGELSLPERRNLRRLVRLLIAEKYWEGCGGFELNDVHKAVIAAQAAVLILELGIDAYRSIETILVYPSTVVPKRGIFAESRGGELADEAGPVVGQAWQRGPVILAWDASASGGRNDEDGANVVYHEFAHKLDMADGFVDGMPPLANEAARQRWRSVFDRVYAQLQHDIGRGKRTFLDRYAAESPVELFAVATEHFFEQPQRFERLHPAMYALMAEFYRQDPVRRRQGASARPWRVSPRPHRAGVARAPKLRDVLNHQWRRFLDVIDPFLCWEALFVIVMFIAIPLFVVSLKPPHESILDAGSQRDMRTPAFPR